MKRLFLAVIFLFSLSALNAADAVPAAAAAGESRTQQETATPQEQQAAAPNQEAAKKNTKPERNLKKGLTLAATQDDLFEDIPEGTLAVYIDIEEAFNKNPWTLQARRNIRLDLEARQLEYAQIQEQVRELRLKEKNLMEEIAYHKPFYEPARHIEPAAQNIFPKLQEDNVGQILNIIIFSASDARVESPKNSPQKLAALEEAVKDTKKSIIEKENFLLNYKEISKDEILAQQDYIVQEVLKEIYSGIKEYAKVRNIGLIVDKKDLIYGKPLNVTNEFVRWMKTYHKKYVKEHGDIL